MKMPRRLTISLDSVLETAIEEAPARLRLAESSSASERLREYARRGYEAALDEERLATYRRWADEPEMGMVAKAAFRSGIERGLFQD